MSLYQVQKLLYRMNADPKVAARFAEDRAALLDEHALEPAERRALEGGDVGRLWVMGAHPFLLCTYATRVGLDWPGYMAALKAVEAEKAATP